MIDVGKCKHCAHYIKLPYGEPCNQCEDNDHFSEFQIPPSPEVLFAGCLKNIGNCIETMAKLQDDLNSQLREMSLVLWHQTESIVFIKKKLDGLFESVHTLHQEINPDSEIIIETPDTDYIKEAKEFLNALQDMVKEDQSENLSSEH